mmetsp:Transcript_43345/g.114325  ORF Transcript_43345/g.114325 Transcript_43345/m.114325 type:complete len:787 (-) Transcript_43345:387-2747(-)
MMLGLVEHSWYDRFMNFLILANAVSMGIEADSELYDPSVSSFLQGLEHGFLACFSFELIVHLLLFRLAFVKSPWGAFDCVIVTFGICDQWILPLVVTLDSHFKVLLTFRVLRLVRITRAVRLMSQFRVMWMLVRSLGGALVTLFWAVLLLCTIVYVFAIVAVELVYKLGMHSVLAAGDLETGEIIDRCFGTVAKSMFTLFQITTLDSWSPIVRPILFHHWQLIFFFGPFIGISAIAVMNLVTAIIVETSRETAFQDKAMMKKFLDQQAKHTLHEVASILNEADLDGSGDVTKEELVETYSTNERVRAKIDGVCDFAELVELFDFFDDEGDGALTFEELSTFFQDYKVNPVRALQVRTLKRLSDLELSVHHIIHEIDGAHSARRRQLPDCGLSNAGGEGSFPGPGRARASFPRSSCSSGHQGNRLSPPDSNNAPRSSPRLSSRGASRHPSPLSTGGESGSLRGRRRAQTPCSAVGHEIDLCADLKSFISSELGSVRQEVSSKLDLLFSARLRCQRGPRRRAVSEDVDCDAGHGDAKTLTRREFPDSPKLEAQPVPGGAVAADKATAEVRRTPSTGLSLSDHELARELHPHEHPGFVAGFAHGLIPSGELPELPDDVSPFRSSPSLGGRSNGGPQRSTVFPSFLMSSFSVSVLRRGCCMLGIVHFGLADSGHRHPGRPGCSPCGVPSWVFSEDADGGACHRDKHERSRCANDRLPRIGRAALLLWCDYLAADTEVVRARLTLVVGAPYRLRSVRVTPTKARFRLAWRTDWSFASLECSGSRRQQEVWT